MSRRDRLAESAIIAIVVVVLGIAATRTKLEPAPNAQRANRVVAEVRMIMPLARDCARSDGDNSAACEPRAAARARP